MLSKAKIIPLALVLTGCGGPGSTNGTVMDERLEVKAAIMNTGYADGVLSLHLLEVPHERACELRGKLSDATEAQQEGPELIFHVFLPETGAAPLEYVVVSDQAYRAAQQRSGQVWGSYATRNAGVRSMTSGTLTLDAFEPGANGHARGSFLVKFGSDALMGSFDATPCASK
ncbi:MAG: hypothetical protein WBV82_16115 [Myxococcaceae bacterium]